MQRLLRYLNEFFPKRTGFSLSHKNVSNPATSSAEAGPDKPLSFKRRPRRKWSQERWFLLSAAAALSTGDLGCVVRQFRQQPGAIISTKVPALRDAEFLDANDVSILIPLELIRSTDDNNPFLAKKYLRQAQFDQVLINGQNQGPNKISEINFKNPRRNVSSLGKTWRVVSMRYDPCAPGAHAADTFHDQQKSFGGNEAPGRDFFCSAQVRLVIQPFLKGEDQDFTMHLVYHLDKSEEALEQQVRGLLSIKQAATRAGAPTTGRALGIHPGLSSQKNSEVVHLFVEFLQTHANPQNLSSIAVMALAGSGPEPWTFYANLVREGKVLSGAAPIPTVDKNPGIAAQFQSLAFVGPQRVLGLPSNTTTFRFVREEDVKREPKLRELLREPILLRSTATILNSGLTKDGNTQQDGSQLKIFDDQSIMPLDDAKLDLLHAIDNPDRNHFFSLDCISCHTSANLLLRRHDVIKDNPALASTDELERIRDGKHGRFSVPKGTTAFVAKAARQDQALFGRPWSLRNFGYFQGKASIAFRTATETGEVLREIHEEMMGKEAHGPNACASVPDDKWPIHERKLWTCIHFDEESEATCLQTICNLKS